MDLSKGDRVVRVGGIEDRIGTIQEVHRDGTYYVAWHGERAIARSERAPDIRLATDEELKATKRLATD